MVGVRRSTRLSHLAHPRHAVSGRRGAGITRTCRRQRVSGSRGASSRRAARRSRPSPHARSCAWGGERRATKAARTPTGRGPRRSPGPWRSVSVPASPGWSPCAAQPAVGSGSRAIRPRRPAGTRTGTSRARSRQRGRRRARPLLPSRPDRSGRSGGGNMPTTEELLAQVPLFKDLSKKHLQQVSNLATRIDFPAGKVLAQEGEPGHEFVVILDGEVEIRKGDEVIATRGPGSYVGEIALLEHRPRTATVVATTPV